MKTAISLPDPLFEEADAHARGIGVSRSELYRRALEEYLARHAPDRVTEALDTLCDSVDTSPGPFVTEAGRGALEREDS